MWWVLANFTEVHPDQIAFNLILFAVLAYQQKVSLIPLLPTFLPVLIVWTQRVCVQQDWFMPRSWKGQGYMSFDVLFSCRAMQYLKLPQTSICVSVCYVGYPRLLGISNLWIGRCLQRWLHNSLVMVHCKNQGTVSNVMSRPCDHCSFCSSCLFANAFFPFWVVVTPFTNLKSFSCIWVFHWVNWY